MSLYCNEKYENVFPTLEKYIDYVHTIDGVPFNVSTDLQYEIKSMFKNMISLEKWWTNLFFTDIYNKRENITRIN